MTLKEYHSLIVAFFKRSHHRNFYMDIVTQGLLGSTVGVAGYGKKLGRRAAIYGFIIGLLPDFDIVAGYWGPWASLKYHRGPTHAFLALLLLSVPIGLACRRLSRSDAKKHDWVGLAFLSLITHPIIDWFTAYGTVLAWPLNYERYAIDALPIIDAVFSLPLLCVAVLGIFSHVSSQRMRSLAIIALTVSTIYSFLGWNASQTLVARGTELFKAQGFEPVEVRAMPTMLNIVVFRVVGRDAAGRHMVTYLKKSSPQPLTKIVTLEPDNDDYVKLALQHEHGQLFKWFAMNMLHTQSIHLEDGSHKVVLHDVRYGLFLDPARALFAAEAHFDKNGQLKNFVRVQNHRSISMKKELAATLAHVFGGPPDNIPAAYGDQ